MRAGAVVLLALAFTSGACPAAEERAPLNAVTAIRVANYGAPSVLIKERQQVRALIDELIAARRQPWRRGDSKLLCYSTVVLLMEEKTMVALFRIASDRVVERPVEKGKSSYTLLLGDTDLPGLRKLLTEIAPARCRAPTGR